MGSSPGVGIMFPLVTTPYTGRSNWWRGGVRLRHTLFLSPLVLTQPGITDLPSSGENSCSTHQLPVTWGRHVMKSRDEGVLKQNGCHSLCGEASKFPKQNSYLYFIIHIYTLGTDGLIKHMCLNRIEQWVLLVCGEISWMSNGILFCVDD